MKRIILILVLLSVATAMGQSGFKSVNLVEQNLSFVQVTDNAAYVRGHWVGGDLIGPSTSTIFCQHDSMTCTDDNAQLIPLGNTFTLSGGQDVYRIERWNHQEIVASNIGGICKIRNVIKFDRVHKQVFYMQTLSEPNPSNLENCNPKYLIPLSELKDSTSFYERDAKGAR